MSTRRRWGVEGTNEFVAWYDSLTGDESERVDAAVEILMEGGPAEGRPLVDTVRGSRHANMKELRPRGGYLRILFAFDPRRTAILLIGGDKTDRWQEWYDVYIPIADGLYDLHLETLRREGGLR